MSAYPFGKGICGAVTLSGKTIVVPNVKNDPRYLADSQYTKSEIVVPVVAHQKLIAEIDVSSFFEGAFDDEIRKFLARCSVLVGDYVERHPTT